MPDMAVNADNTRDYNYIYDYWGNANNSVAAFQFGYAIDKTAAGQYKISSIDDIYVSGGKIYMIDSVESRLHIFDDQYQFIKSIKLIRNQNNKIVVNEDNVQMMLTKPEGVFVSEDTGEIYIADTGAERIIVLDKDQYFLKRVIERPDNMVGVTAFKPSKLVVDSAGRIFIVVQGSYEGIIELNKDGSFSRYFGVNKPKVNILDYFWKSIASDVQKEKMKKVYAPSFNNLEIDSEGFIYATTQDTAAQEMVFRLNSKGENVIRSLGYAPIIGDLSMGSDANVSKFVDIAVSDYGTYALLDQAKGRVFIYNFDGNLLNIFNSIGDMKGNVKEPSSIAWLDDKLIIADKKLGSAFVFYPTEFGKAALGAAEEYYHGNWEKAGELLKKAVELNANYDIAYVGIGKNLLMQDKYEEAMYYFKLGNDRTYYSKAYNGYRNILIQKNFGYVIGIFLIFAFGIIYSEYKYHRKIKEMEG